MYWGEFVIEAANRELLEETGLKADFEYRLLYHKRDFDKQSRLLLEDGLFLCVHATELSGERSLSGNYITTSQNINFLLYNKGIWI